MGQSFLEAGNKCVHCLKMEKSLCAGDYQLNSIRGCWFWERHFWSGFHPVPNRWKDPCHLFISVHQTTRLPLLIKILFYARQVSGPLCHGLIHRLKKFPLVFHAAREKTPMHHKADDYYLASLSLSPDHNFLFKEKCCLLQQLCGRKENEYIPREEGWAIPL